MAVYPRAIGCISTCNWLYIHLRVAVYPCSRGRVSHVHMTMYPRAPGCVSMYMCPCINVHVAVNPMHMAVYPRGDRVSTCIWACIYVQAAVYRLSNKVFNFKVLENLYIRKFVSCLFICNNVNI